MLCQNRYDAFCSHVFDYACLRRNLRLILLSKRFKIMEKLYTSKTFLKMAGGRGSASDHKLQKPSKESGIFYSLGTTIFFFFTKRQS